jgi:Short-chain dehydrogenases of various substrate specificities
MAGFFDSLRIELADEGVSVTMAYPGFVATEIATRALGPDGKPLGKRPVDDRRAIPVDECARRIIDAAAKRSREVIMARRAKLGMILKALAPARVDKMAAKGIRRGRS